MTRPWWHNWRWFSPPQWPTEHRDTFIADFKRAIEPESYDFLIYAAPAGRVAAISLRGGRKRGSR
jgi:hypothetical protein